MKNECENDISKEFNFQLKLGLRKLARSIMLVSCEDLLNCFKCVFKK